MAFYSLTTESKHNTLRAVWKISSTLCNKGEKLLVIPAGEFSTRASEAKRQFTRALDNNISDA